MAAPPIYADECLDHRAVGTFTELGCDTLTVEDAGTRHGSDEDQLLFATREGRLLVSHNQRDFRRLHERFLQQGREHHGILLIPQTVPLTRLRARVVLLIDWISTFPDTRSRLFTWGDLQQWLIHGYRPPGLHWTEEDVRHALAWA
jgi:hypothetical protein